MGQEQTLPWPEAVLLDGSTFPHHQPPIIVVYHAENDLGMILGTGSTVFSFSLAGNRRHKTGQDKTSQQEPICRWKI